MPNPKTYTPGSVGEWFNADPTLNLRRGLSPVSWAKSAGGAFRFGKGAAGALGLGFVGYELYHGANPARLAVDYATGMAAGVAGARVGGAAGHFALRNITKETGRMAGRFGATKASSSLISAAKTVGRFGTVGGGVAGGLIAIAGVSAMVDYLSSAPQKAMDHGKRLRQLETGGNFKDPYGTAFTMRQRSLQAINKSHLNARTALGNEAGYNHSR